MVLYAWVRKRRLTLAIHWVHSLEKDACQIVDCTYTPISIYASPLLQHYFLHEYACGPHVYSMVMSTRFLVK